MNEAQYYAVDWAPYLRNLKAGMAALPAGHDYRTGRALKLAKGLHAYRAAVQAVHGSPREAYINIRAWLGLSPGVARVWCRVGEAFEMLYFHREALPCRLGALRECAMLTPSQLRTAIAQGRIDRTSSEITVERYRRSHRRAGGAT